jgi:hypothetical protein
VDGTDQLLAEKLRSGHYSFVLLGYDITDRAGAERWSPRLFAALKDGYKLLYSDSLFIYQPRSPR